MTPPAKRTPAKSLAEALGQDNDKEENKVNDGNTSSSDSAKTSSRYQTKEERKESDAELNPTVDAVEMDDVKSSLASGTHKGPSPEEEDNSDQAPGDGIIKEEDAEDDDEVLDRREAALRDSAVLSRVHKMNSPGMTVLNTYSGGNEVIDHGEVNVTVKPLTDVVVKRERTIVDETGKSRLLHPDITTPYVPSEQAMIQQVVTQHVYATPYDPDADPNR